MTLCNYIQYMVGDEVRVCVEKGGWSCYVKGI